MDLKNWLHKQHTTWGAHCCRVAQTDDKGMGHSPRKLWGGYDGRKSRLGHASSFLHKRVPWYVSSEVSSVVPMSLDAHTTTGSPCAWGPSADRRLLSRRASHPVLVQCSAFSNSSPRRHPATRPLVQQTRHRLHTRALTMPHGAVNDFGQ